MPNSCPASPSRHGGGIYHYAGYTAPLRPNIHANSTSNAITPPTPPTQAHGRVTPNNNQPQQRAANLMSSVASVQQPNIQTKNTISISPIGSGMHSQFQVQLPQGVTQQMPQLPQFAPGGGNTFVPLSNSHPTSDGLDHLMLEDQKPDLGQLTNQQQAQNAIVYPSEDGQHLSPMPGGQNMIQQGGAAQVRTK